MKKILIIEDEPDLCKIYRLRLESKYEIIVAQDGMEGLEKARHEKPDLILLDLMLPKLGGMQVCRLLKFDEKYRNIPILIVTARGQIADKEMMTKMGANDYIIKPFKTEELIGKIEGIIEK